MNSNWKLSLGSGAALLLAATTQAQDPVKLLGEGDLVSFGTVTAVSNVDVNNSGDWMVEFDTDAISNDDNGVMLNGTLIYRERTNMGIPASHAANWRYDGFVDTMDINDNGDYMVLMHVEDPIAPMSATDSDLLIWTSGTSGISYVLWAEDETPNLGDPDQTGAPLWDSINEVWQNNNNQMIIAGRSTTDADDMLVFIEHDGAGTLTTQTVFAIDGVNHAVAFPPSNGIHATNVAGFTTSKVNISLNNPAQKMFYVDDDHVAPGGDTNFDAHYYVDTTEVNWEGNLAPFNTTTMTQSFWNHLSSAEVDLNDAGTFVAQWDDDGATSNDFMIVTSSDLGATITPFVREGEDLIHAAGTGFLYSSFFGATNIASNGDLTFAADWNDPDTTIDSGLYRNSTLLLQEGVSTDMGGIIIDTISTSGDGRAVSDDGRYIICELTLVGSLEGAYLIDTAGMSFTSYCFGDGGTAPGCTDCPCGNNALAGSPGGCLNSSGTSAELVASGNPEVGNDSMRFEVVGANPAAFGILTSGDNMLPQMGSCPIGSGITSPALDGLRCQGGSALRHGTRATDANGDIGATTAGWGFGSGPAGGLIAFNGFAAGQTRNFQCFYREDALLGCATGQNTTNAISVTFQ